MSPKTATEIIYQLRLENKKQMLEQLANGVLPEEVTLEVYDNSVGSLGTLTCKVIKWNQPAT